MSNSADKYVCFSVPDMTADLDRSIREINNNLKRINLDLIMYCGSLNDFDVETLRSDFVFSVDLEKQEKYRLIYTKRNKLLLVGGDFFILEKLSPYGLDQADILFYSEPLTGEVLTDTYNMAVDWFVCVKSIVKFHKKNPPTGLCRQVEMHPFQKLSQS